MELRIFTRDGQRFSRAIGRAWRRRRTAMPTLMAEFLNDKNGQTWQSIPVAVFYTKDLEYLYHYTEFPAIYLKDRLVSGHIRAPRPGETKEDDAGPRRPRVLGAAAIALLSPLGERGRGRDHQRAAPAAHPRRARVAAEITMPIARLSDVELYYEETGEGVPLVWSHEFGGDHRSWEPQVRYFSRRYRVVTYNHRGYAPSSVPKEAARLFPGHPGRGPPPAAASPRPRPRCTWGAARWGRTWRATSRSRTPI